MASALDPAGTWDWWNDDEGAFERLRRELPRSLVEQNTRRWYPTLDSVLTVKQRPRMETDPVVDVEAKSASSDDLIHDPPLPHDLPEGTAMIFYSDGYGRLQTLGDISTSVLHAASPLLAQALEASPTGPKLVLEILTPETALDFFRYLLTDSYAIGDLFDDVPTSVLHHCQMFRLGALFEIPNLKTQAYVNVMRQCEFGCSSPDKPIDLCGAITFAYEHLREHNDLVELMLNYCVACFLRHNLAEDGEFARLFYEQRDFVLDLCRVVRERGFEDESAQAIIQMRSKPFVPDTYASREDLSPRKVEDIVFRFHCNDEFDLPIRSPRKKRKCSIPAAPKIEEFHGDLPFDFDLGDTKSADAILPLRPAVKEAHDMTVRPDGPPGETPADSPSQPRSLLTAILAKQETCEQLPPEPSGSVQAEIQREEEGTSSSDSEFERVNGAAEVEAIDSDVESNGQCGSDFEMLERQPKRRAEHAAIREVDKTDGAEEDSESDWSLL